MSADRLPGAVRLLVAGSVVNKLGSGLVLPLPLIYLHQVRGIALPVVGLLLTLSAVAGLVAVPVSGALLDRAGPRRVLTVSLAGQALAQAGLAWVHSVPTAVPVLLLYGVSLGPSFPAFQTLLAGAVTRPDLQQRAFAVNFTGVNAGVGARAAIGAAVAGVQDVASFQVLFLGNALSCLLFAAILLRLPNVRAPRERRRAATGYRDVLAHRGLRAVLVAALVLSFTGYAAIDSGLPAYGTVEAHVSVHVVALSLTVNTIIIVAGQLGMLRVVRLLRRSRALAVIGLIWAVAWAIFGLSALPAGPAARIGCVFAFTGLFGVGEMFLAPTVPVLVNSLAPDRIRGRANALSSAGVSLALVVSPALSTGLIAAGLAAAWIGLLCAGCLATALLGLRLGRQLTPAQDRVMAVPAPEPAAA